MAGMGLIDAETVFEKQKVRERVSGKFLKTEGVFEKLSGADFEGYEIHMGRTVGKTPALCEITTLNGGRKTDGMSNGNVYGCYVHGIFDSSDVLNGIADTLLELKGMDSKTADRSRIDINAYKDRQYDILADTLRKALDMEKVYQILEAGV